MQFECRTVNRSTPYETSDVECTIEKMKSGTRDDDVSMSCWVDSSASWNRRNWET